MKNQLKRFIDPGDVIAVRIDCKHCHATISLPVSKDIDVIKLLVCPYCTRPWLRLPDGTTGEMQVQKCIREISVLSEMLASGRFSGFSLQLEITTDGDGA